MMQRKIVPDIVERSSIATMTANATVQEAAKVMAGKNIAAMIVVDDDSNITGIVTERDMTQRVIAQGIDAQSTAISKIMTANPDTLSPDDSAGDALELMHSRSYRHLPVAVDGKCVAMVSIRDLYVTMKAALEEDIRETEAFVFGDRYGA